MKKREFPFSIYFYRFAAKYSYALLLHKRLHLKKYSNILSFLEKDCSSILDRYRDENVVLSAPIPKQLWVLWWQGKDNLPPIVKECVKRMASLEGYKLTVLDKENISSYIDLSDVLPLLESGELKIQFMSDIIRMRILRKHGGFWIDSTMLIMDESFLDNIVDNYSFYSIRLKDFEEWWTIIDYFQIDFTVRLGYENLPWIRNLIDSFPYYENDMFYLDKVSSKVLTEKKRALIDSAPMYKLNWRKKIKTLDNRTTCYEYAIKRLGLFD